MRNTVAKQLRKVTVSLNRNKAWYRQLKRHWSMMPQRLKHDALDAWVAMAQRNERMTAAKQKKSENNQE